MKNLTVIGSKLSESIQFGGLFVVGSKLSEQGRSQLRTSLGLSPPAPPTQAPLDDADKLLESVASQLDPADLAAIRADPEAKRLFVKRLVNQRELNEESRKQRETAAATAREQASVAELNRLAALGSRVAKDEVDK